MVVGNNPLSETSECQDSSQAQVTDFEVCAQGEHWDSGVLCNIMALI